MKFRVLSVSLVLVLGLSGCGQKDGSPTAGAPEKAQTGPRTIEITASDQMKFSVNAIEAKVGEEIKIVLTNIGTLPKDAMGHNLVILKPGSDDTAYSAAAALAKDTDYFPPALNDQVVAHTILLGPRKSDEIKFKAEAPGVYPFLCSFPAHHGVGMKGTITVK